MTKRRMVWAMIRALAHRIARGGPVQVLPPFIEALLGEQMIRCPCGCTFINKPSGLTQTSYGAACPLLSFMRARRALLVPRARMVR